MRRFLFPILLLLFLMHGAQAAPQQYSNVWRPITETQISADVQSNHLSGVGLEQTMMRALMQSQGLPYLRAIKVASDAEPKNATLLAAYGWALAMVKNSYTFDTKSRPVPEQFKQFDFSWQNIHDTIQRAKELDAHCWLAYVADSTLETGGPPPTKEAAALKKAFEIQRNAVTLTRYGSALIFEGAGANDVAEMKEGRRLLLMAQQRYPTYFKANYEVFAAYGYPAIADKEKSLAALQQLYVGIPPEYRHSPWVVRYFKYLGLDRFLPQIGVTL